VATCSFGHEQNAADHENRDDHDDSPIEQRVKGFRRDPGCDRGNKEARRGSKNVKARPSCSRQSPGRFARFFEVSHPVELKSSKAIGP